MESLNPMFQNTHSKKGISIKKESETLPPKKRQIRSDKCHNIKFPVTPIMQMKLRTYCKQINGQSLNLNGQVLSQTIFNTTLLQFGLSRTEIIEWNLTYEDTKTYMHTMLKEPYYQRIGGPYGIAIQKHLSERKAAFMIIASVLSWIEKGGSLEEIIQ